MSFPIRATHKCELQDNEVHMVNRLFDTWVLMTKRPDFGCFKCVATIEYCPFCGDKLINE